MTAMKYEQYAQLIVNAVSDMLHNEDSEFYIGTDITEGNNATHFFHALATVAPNYVYNKLSDQKINNLEFNQIANTMCFQFCKSEKDN